MASSRRNRVDPTGALIADPARGTLMGNRGCLHDEDGTILRTHRLKRWIYCRLEFKGRRRKLMQPGLYTELFFLDEATALAAGHRPCAECMRGRFNEFRDCLGELLSAPDLDDALHRERIAGADRKVTFEAPLGDLPDGTFVMTPGLPGAEPGPCLVRSGELWPWRPGGYEDGRPFDPAMTAEVLTPAMTVAALRRGFQPTPVT